MTNLRPSTNTLATTEHVVRLARIFNFPPDVVFQAWIDPAQLVQWWGPKQFHVTHCELNINVGGNWRICMQSPQGMEHWVSGVYTEIVESKRLSFTWAWEREGVRGVETKVTIELRALQKKTELILTHQLFESSQAYAAHERGWLDSLDALAQILS